MAGPLATSIDVSQLELLSSWLGVLLMLFIMFTRDQPICFFSWPVKIISNEGDQYPIFGTDNSLCAVKKILVSKI